MTEMKSSPSPVFNFSWEEEGTGFGGRATSDNDGGDDNNTRGLISAQDYLGFLIFILVFRFANCLVGITGNVLNIRTFLRMGVGDAVTLVFFNLALVDLLTLTTTLTHGVTRICQFLQDDGIIQMAMPIVYTEPFFIILGRTLSDMIVFLVTFLAIQRCICVAMPFRFKGMFTMLRTAVVVAFMWIYCIIGAGVHFSQYEIRRVIKPNTTIVFYRVIQKPTIHQNAIFIRIVNGIIFNQTCQVIVLLCVLIMAKTLRSSLRFRQSGLKSSAAPAKEGEEEDGRSKARAVTEVECDNNRSISSSNKKDAASNPASNLASNPASNPAPGPSLGNSKERQVIVQVLIVSVFFLITNIPYMAVSMASLVEPELTPYRKYRNTFRVVFGLQRAIDNLNSSANFFIYYNYSTKFRQFCFKRKK